MYRLAAVACGLALLLGAEWYFMDSRGDDDDSSFATDRQPQSADGFDGERALTYLKAICKIGPRQSGSAGMKQQIELLQKHFEKLGGVVTKQTFNARQVSRAKPVEMTNLIVSWNPDEKRRVILCSHYDTRPIADQEPQRSKWLKPFLSANDGGSGVALLMELAHHMKDLKTKVGVDFVFFDGEEYIFDPSPEEEGGDQYFFGSKHFAQQYRTKKGKTVYAAAILLDMIGGKNARFYVEWNSANLAGKLVEDVWKTAAALKCAAFHSEIKHRVTDDHIPLNQAKIPAIDIIDFDYPHWHRLSDVPENCSAESIRQVAGVLMAWLEHVK
jgi:hypothetical protein